MEEKNHFLLRKLLHVFIGLLSLWLIMEFSIRFGLITFRWILLGVVLVFLLIDYLRIEHQISFSLYKKTEKSKEKGRMHAITYGAISVCLCIYFFDFGIALTALAMQFVGDGAAAIFGKYFGKKKLFRSKTIVGTGAMFVTSFFIGYALLQHTMILFGMALAAALTELLIDGMEDNLIVPLVTGTVGIIIGAFV